MIESKNLNSYSSYIFDFDGVLYNTRMANQEAYKETFSALNINIKDSVLSSINGQSWDQFLQSSRLQLSPEDISSIRKRKAETYPNYFHLIERNNVLFEFIGEIKMQSKTITIASSASLNNINNVLRHFSDTHHFDLILSRDHIENPKPHPEIYNKSLDSLGVSADDCIVFEDSEDGILAAQAADINTVRVDTFNDARNQK